jgi:hypothetical protein
MSMSWTARQPASELQRGAGVDRSAGTGAAMGAGLSPRGGALIAFPPADGGFSDGHGHGAPGWSGAVVRPAGMVTGRALGASSARMRLATPTSPRTIIATAHAVGMALDRAPQRVKPAQPEHHRKGAQPERGHHQRPPAALTVPAAVRQDHSHPHGAHR